MRLTRNRRRAAVGLVGSAALLSVGLVATPASAAPTPHVISGSVPTWTAHAKAEGATAGSSTVDFGVLLSMRNHETAVSTLQKVSTPSSASYGKWLSTKQFQAQYAPTRATVTAVQKWLRGQGFTVGETMPSGMYVEVSGTAAQVSKTFGTPLENFSYRGKTLRANTKPVVVPASAPAGISGVVGVDDSQLLKQHDWTQVGQGGLPGPPPGARYGDGNCSSYFGQKIRTDVPKAHGKYQPAVVCGYTPQQYQSAYGVSPLLTHGVDGSGVTVAITDAYASPTMAFDAQTYSAVHGLPQLKKGQYKEILPKQFGYPDPSLPQGWYGEETLDVEAVHSMAPGANILYVGGRNSGGGLDNAWAKVIDKHLADIVTNSWSYGSENLPASLQQFYDQFALEAALTGITDNFSTGDDGDYTSGGTNLAGKAVGLPASDPWVSGIGGTSIAINGSGARTAEYGWQSAYAVLKNGSWTPNVNGTYSSGGGGGTSKLYAQPFYQQGKVPARDSRYYGGAPMRTLPDISMAGDPNTGFIVGETQTFPEGTYWSQYRIGGTSLSSPLMAGVIAVANQAVGHPLGFTNPLYYDMLGKNAVYDVVAPSNPVNQVRTNFNNNLDASQGKTTLLQTIDVQTTTLHATRGYDTETGVGAPNGPAFFYYLKRTQG